MELDLQRFYNINRRILMWAAFFGGLYLLRDFFAVMFLTFIFGFLMRGAAKFLSRKARLPYWSAVVFPYLIAVGLLILLIMVAVPRVVDEGVRFSKDVPGLLRTLAESVRDASQRYGLEPALAKYANRETASASPAESTQGTEATPKGPPVTLQVNIKDLTAKIQQLLLQVLPGVVSAQQGGELPDLLRSFLKGLLGGTLQFLLAILLSFLIVLDFEGIAAELAKWRESPVGRFFHEAAASVVQFSGMIGKAFQCQLAVAFLNAAITSMGLFILDIQPLLLLTTIVFLFGLIPVLGVFISSVPIILIAFNDRGLHHALLALGVIVIVHLLEAYVFNPRIYAARFHLNPVIVLIILLVAHKLFGIWGMLLGIPVTHYVLNIAQLPAQPRRVGFGRLRKSESSEPVE